MQLITRQLMVNKLSRRQYQGKEYAVAPIIAVIAGELNGEVLPIEEIESSLAAWDGVPITNAHPRKDGQYVSAQDGDFGVGIFRNPRIDSHALKGEAWLDPAIEGALPIINRLDDGELLEVSTGYFADVVVNESGERKQEKVKPDHVAILIDEIGACSVKDGCGIPRINKEQEGKSGMDENEVVDEIAAEEPCCNDETPVVNEDVTEEPAMAPEIAELKHLIEEFGGVDGIRSLLTEIKTNAEAQRNALVTKAAEVSGLDAADLEGMSDEALGKLAEKFATPKANYAAAGAATPKANAREFIPYAVPTLDR